MKRIKISISLAALAISLAINSFVAHAQSEVTQAFTLKPGWNAIYLEVQPDPSDTQTVFSELENLESVWAWLDTHSTAEFIRDPDEGLWNQPGWGVYLKAPERQFLNSLHAVIAGWTVRYAGIVLFQGFDAGIADRFGDIASGWDAFAYHVAFMLGTVLIVGGGIKGGIERTALWMAACRGDCRMGGSGKFRYYAQQQRQGENQSAAQQAAGHLAQGGGDRLAGFLNTFRS